MMTWLTIVATLVVALLLWELTRRFGADRLTGLSDHRRSSARLVSQGEFVDGNRRMAVALALTDSTIIYENSDLEASLGLEWVREIEYDSVLATGLAVHDGKVLRLRCDSQTFEFVLPLEVVSQWLAYLPTRSAREGSVFQP